VQRPSVGLVVVAAVLSAIAGYAFGRFEGGGGDYALILAGLSVLATVAAPLAVQWWSDSTRASADLRAEARRASKRFSRHSVDLNDHVFKFMVNVRIEAPLERNPPFHPEGFGLVVPYPGSPNPIGVAGLGNWPFGREHFLANSVVNRLWEQALTAASKFYTTRDVLVRDITAKLRDRIQSEYGADMRMDGSASDSAPWTDVEGLCWFAMAKRAAGYHPFYATPIPEPPPGSPGPFYVSWGQGSFQAGRSRRESEPGKLQRIFEDIVNESNVKISLDQLIGLANSAEGAVSELAEGFRVYSNRVTLARTFEGVCEVCQPWVRAPATNVPPSIPSLPPSGPPGPPTSASRESTRGRNPPG
jgi:hypothetical protein